MASDQPENLILVYLRRLDERMERMELRLLNLEGEMVTMRRQIAVIIDNMAHERAARAAIEGRLDRIERRLQIAEGVP